MRGEFRSYNAAYADALNEQMLLNLARLENGHPAYYLAIGAINNRFIDTMSGAVGSTGTAAQNTNTSTQNTPIVRGTPSAIAQFPARVVQTVTQTLFGYSGSAAYMHEKNPDFQFIPLNNEEVAKQVLEPVLPDVFFTLYNQGYPIDQLMRVMIERVETTLPKTREQVTLINSPAEGKAAAESYARFLRGCAILREMQRLGYLTLESHTHYESLGPISFDTPNNGVRTNPTSKEFAEAEKNGFELRQEENPDDPTKGKRWEIERKHSAPVFHLKQQDSQTVVRNLIRDEKLSAKLRPEEIANPEKAIANLVGLLENGIAVQTTVGDVKHATTRLVLRSFDRSMTAVAMEQPAFDEFNTQGEADIVPDIERQPILRMMWPDKSKPLAPPLETIRYSGKTYEITDPVMKPLESAAHWNRDVFRLLVALNSQVTVDISKFQRQVLELLPIQ